MLLPRSTALDTFLSPFRDICFYFAILNHQFSVSFSASTNLSFFCWFAIPAGRFSGKDFYSWQLLSPLNAREAFPCFLTIEGSTLFSSQHTFTNCCTVPAMCFSLRIGRASLLFCSHPLAKRKDVRASELKAPHLLRGRPKHALYRRVRYADANRASSTVHGLPRVCVCRFLVASYPCLWTVHMAAETHHPSKKYRCKTHHLCENLSTPSISHPLETL